MLIGVVAGTFVVGVLSAQNVSLYNETGVSLQKWALIWEVAVEEESDAQ